MLAEFLQQNLHKELTHTILAQLQQQHSSAEDLIDQLSRLRSYNKLEHLEQRQAQVSSYSELRQNIAKTMMNLDRGVVGRLVQQCLSESDLAGHLAMMESKNIEVMVMGALKQIFLMGSDVSREEESLELKSYSEMLANLRIKMQSGAQVSRSQLQKVSVLENKFLQHRSEFEGKIAAFNSRIQQMFARMQIFQRKMRSQFVSLLGINQVPQYSFQGTPKKAHTTYGPSTTPWNNLPSESYIQEDEKFPRSTMDSRFPTHDYLD